MMNIDTLSKKFSEQLFGAGLNNEFDVNAMFVEFISHYEKKKKKSRKPRKKTAYNIFIKEKMPEMKKFLPKERFRELGKLWKSYSDDDKVEWKNKANVVNIEEVPVEEVPVEEVPVAEVPVEEASAEEAKKE